MMAIRIRFNEDGGYVALCAVESKAERGDVYLNDGMHTALSEKFTEDFKKMGFLNTKFYET